MQYCHTAARTFVLCKLVPQARETPRELDPKVRAVTVIPKLCLRATLDFGIFSPPLQLLHLMANATLEQPQYLPKKDAPTGLSLCGLCGHVFSHGGPALLHMALQKHRLHLSSTLSMRAKPSAPEQQYELRHT